MIITHPYTVNCSEALASSPANLSSDVISPAAPTTIQPHPARLTSPPAGSGHLLPGGPTSPPASGGQLPGSSQPPPSGNSAGGSAGNTGPASVVPSGGYNQPEGGRYSGTELVMLYDYKVRISCFFRHFSYL